MKLKNRVFNIVTSFAILLFASHLSHGQINSNTNTNKNVSTGHSSHSDHSSHSNHCSTVSLKKQIKLTDFDSEKRDIKLSIAKNTSRISLNVNCLIEVGELTVEVYNYKGKKQVDFYVEGT